jgi:hypothetical protein
MKIFIFIVLSIILLILIFNKGANAENLCCIEIKENNEQWLRCMPHDKFIANGFNKLCK